MQHMCKLKISMVVCYIYICILVIVYEYDGKRIASINCKDNAHHLHNKAELLNTCMTKMHK